MHVASVNNIFACRYSGGIGANAGCQSRRKDGEAARGHRTTSESSVCACPGRPFPHQPVTSGHRRRGATCRLVVTVLVILGGPLGRWNRSQQEGVRRTANKRDACWSNRLDIRLTRIQPEEQKAVQRG